MFSAYLNRLVLAGYRPRTVQARRECLLAFARTIAPHHPNQATRADVEAFLSRPLAPESRRTYRSHLRGYYRWAVEEGVITEDPTQKLPAIRVPSAQPRPVSTADLQLALASAGPRMRAWLLCMALAGLRCVEVAGLRPQDILRTERETLLFLRECKGGGSATIPAHPTVIEALSALPIRNGLWWQVKPATVSTLTRRYLRDAGVHATAHQFRHWAGTSWYSASGHDLLTTAALLRHVNVATTQVYAALDPTRPAEVTRAVQLHAV